MAGLLPAPHATPGCPGARQALGALLTAPLAGKLGGLDPRPALAALNTSTETAHVIWSRAMRDELLAALSDMRADAESGSTVPAVQSIGTAGSTGVAVADGVVGGSSAGAATAATAASNVGLLASWRFSALTQELQVGGVYVRVYCQKPTVLPQDTQGFCKSLVRWAPLMCGCAVVS